MLVISRHKDEIVDIGDEIEITIVAIRGDKVRIGVTAPKHMTVHRREVTEAIKRGDPPRNGKRPIAVRRDNAEGVSE